MPAWKDGSAPFRQRGHQVASSDIDPAFGCTITADVRELTADQVRDALGGAPDVVLASPPCEGFSVASMSRHWGGGLRAYVPLTDRARLGVELVVATVKLIGELAPAFAVVENPRDVLRNLGLMPAAPVTVWYCHYGAATAKPTDLWGMPFPPSWRPRPLCHNQPSEGRKQHPVGCCCEDHPGAPRGAKTGIQGINGRDRYAQRSVVPWQLAESVCLAAESDFEHGRPGVMPATQPELFA